MSVLRKAAEEQETAQEFSYDVDKKKELERARELGYDADKEEKRIHNKGLGEYYGHRKWWSWFILGWISILISFNMGLALLVGFHPYDFNFDKLPWFAASITTETFIQIVGLGYVAAHYLFSDEQKQDKRLRAALLR
ncbi:MAG: hypothetical protein DU429_04695 [Candidatus Tokpelaia sp.]|nr:MAG: hypothetical protein DU430_00690 [Candidatus Tokpelaia sp.]KAA6206926.1 MAG: hypothetical protein DU429_04695 [Candidatus Tokpelaia sp.]